MPLSQPRSQRIRMAAIGFLAGLLLLVLIAAAWQRVSAGRNGASVPLGRPWMQFQATLADAGTFRNASDSVERAFRFTNTGAAPLDVSDVTASCHCTIVSGWKKRYEPGESGEIRIGARAGAVGPAVAQVQVISNSPTSPDTLTLRTDYRPPSSVSASPNPIRLTIGGPPLPVRIVVLRCDEQEAELKDISVKADLPVQVSAVKRRKLARSTLDFFPTEFTCTLRATGGSQAILKGSLHVSFGAAAPELNIPIVVTPF